ncbi:MAG TPA: BlaI/MecI/CopY family transcriptional regulator [Planctomycetaceae bacterium]|jgi:predicted transcriptional regulator|nr:BlaI/MecI/CopY family transcriptional regulator [Planctomycetaceae bacterium]
MTKRGSGKVELPEMSRLELAIMDVVWRLGDCSSAEVIAEFTKRRRLAETTIRTVLANLRKKGYLEPIPTIERGFRLRARVTRDAVAGRTLRGLVANLFGGSPREAIAHLLQDERLDDAELKEIRRLLDEKRGRKGK